MIDVSKNLEFAGSAGVAFPGTTALSLGNTIDLSKTGRDIGNGEDLYLVVRTQTAFTGTTTAASIDVVSSDTDPVPTVGGPAAAWTSPTVHVTGNVYANLAGLPGAGAINTVWAVTCLPRGTYKRYLGLRGNFATAAWSTGKVEAFLTAEANGWKAYEQGFKDVKDLS